MAQIRRQFAALDVQRFLYERSESEEVNCTRESANKLLALGKVQINLPFLSFLRNFVPTYYK